MRRQLTAVAVATALAMAIAAPVAAWDAVSVAITSDRGGATISMTGGIIVPTLLVTPALDVRPAGDLGPKYAAVYTMAPSSHALATQELYPYAQGGPVSFTSTSGAIADHPYAAGWRQADAAVFQAMVDAGLPAAAAANAPVTSSTGTFSDPFLPVIVGLLVVAAVAAVLVPQIRRRGEQHPAA
jgi:hypothetical protein